MEKVVEQKFTAVIPPGSSRENARLTLADPEPLRHKYSRDGLIRLDPSPLRAKGTNECARPLETFYDAARGELVPPSAVARRVKQRHYDETADIRVRIYYFKTALQWNVTGRRARKYVRETRTLLKLLQ